MKRLSLAILLLCLIASNAMAFSPWQWTKTKLQWVKDNKKTVIAGTAALGLTTYVGYKAHKSYKTLINNRMFIEGKDLNIDFLMQTKGMVPR